MPFDLPTRTFIDNHRISQRFGPTGWLGRFTRVHRANVLRCTRLQTASAVPVRPHKLLFASAAGGRRPLPVWCPICRSWASPDRIAGGAVVQCAAVDTGAWARTGINACRSNGIARRRRDRGIAGRGRRSCTCILRKHHRTAQQKHRRRRDQCDFHFVSSRAPTFLPSSNSNAIGLQQFQRLERFRAETTSGGIFFLPK
jgi:hypothetical protein